MVPNVTIVNTSTRLNMIYANYIRHTHTEHMLDEIAGSEISFLEPPGDSR